ncbi:MAG: ribosome silencing factor [Paracoccaceae bacterium]
MQAADAVNNVSPSQNGEFKKSSDALLNCIIKSLSENKAEDITTIDLRGRTSIGDYMVVASGTSTRLVSSISQKLVDTLKTDHRRISKVEGKDAGDWVLIDTGDIIVHVFRPEVREFYQIEKMWAPMDQK